MVNNRLGYLLLLVCLWAQSGLFAQDHRFMVFFTDKDNTYSIDRPDEFLSQRAIDRRIRQNIGVIEEDLPVNANYLNLLMAEGVQVKYTTRWMNGALVQTDSSKLSDIEALNFVSGIEFVAQGPLVTSNPSNFKAKGSVIQGRTQSTEIQNRLLGVDLMQQEGNTGEGILIGIFDGGFLGVDQIPAFSHLFDDNQLVAAYDFVGDSNNIYRYDDHGTKVLSVIGANDPGVFTGSAIGSDFILCVTEDVSGENRVEEYNWLFAAEFADSVGVDIINTSLGYNEFDESEMDYQLQEMDGVSATISQAANKTASKGIVLTISAGNEGNSSWKTITAPADVKDALSVGAITEDTIKASFSSTGPTADGRIKPDIVALGVKTAVINRNGNVVFNNGTSFSAPQIAGLTAGVWQSNPEFTYLEVMEAIKQAGHTAQTPNNQTGHGIPHYAAAKKLVLSVDEPQGDQSFVKLYPNPVGNRLFLLSELPLHSMTFFIHNIQGQKFLEDQLLNIRAHTEQAIALPLLPKGIYLVTILTEDSAGTYRLIKE